MKKATLSLLFGIMIFLGCTKEKLVEIPVPFEKQYRWKLDSNFMYNNSIITNSFATENELYLYGKYFSVLTFDKNNKEVIENNTLNGEPSMSLKMPISPNFFINVFRNSVIFTPTQEPAASNNSSYLHYGYVNPKYGTSLALSPYEFGQCMIINKKEQVLIPFTVYDPSINIIDGNIFYFTLADIKMANDGYKTTITKTKTIAISNGGFDVNNLFTHKDYFIAGLRYSNHKIYSDGTVKRIILNKFLQRIIAKNDTLYAFSSGGDIFRSTNDAEDWVKLGTGNPNIANLNYYLIGNEIVGTYMSQLYHFTINGNNLTIEEIDNDGLVARYITSVSKFKDKVFVTTLTGVYTVDYKSFFKYKP
jgi:hypothetical protein